MDSQLTDLASAWVEGSDSSQPGAGTRRTHTAIYGHSGPEVNACDYPQCGKSFSRPYDLTRHRRIHFPDKTLVCHVLGCKYKKKKTWLRKDKFREHLNTHRDKERVECPLHDCGSILLFGDELEAHLAQEHHFLERFRHERFFRSLLIDVSKGRLKCPVNCSYEVNYEKLVTYHPRGGFPDFYPPCDFQRHVETHELEDRVQFAASLKVCRVGLTRGVATCPVCISKVCTSDDDIFKLALHLEYNHTDDLQDHAQKLAELLGCTEFTDFFRRYPLLNGVIQGVLETQKALSLFEGGGVEPSPLTGESYGGTISPVESTSRSKNVEVSSHAECDFGSLNQTLTTEPSTSVLQPAFNSAVIPGQHYNQQPSHSLTYTAPVEDVSRSTTIVSPDCLAHIPASPSGSLQNGQLQSYIGHGLSIGEHSNMLHPQPQYAGFDAIPVTADLAAYTTPMQTVFSNLGVSSIAHSVENMYTHLSSPLDMTDYRYSDTYAPLQGNSYDQGLSNAREQHLIAAYGSRQQNMYDFATSRDALPSFPNVEIGQPYHQSQPARHGFQTGPTFSQPVAGFARGQPGVVFSRQHQPTQYDFQTMSNAMMPNAMMPNPTMAPNTMMPNIPLTIVSDASGQQYAVPSNQLYPTTSGISMPSTTQPFLDNVPESQDSLQVMDDDWGMSDD